MRNIKSQSFSKYVSVSLLIIFLFLLPLFLSKYSPYWLDVVTMLGINLILAVSFKLTTITKNWSFAHVVFAGLGGYMSAIFVKNISFMPFWLSLPLSVLVVALVAFLVSYPLFKTGNFYFFLASYAVAELITQIWINFENPFGGYAGISNIPPPDSILGVKFVDPIANYYLIWIFAFVSIAIIWTVERSEIGSTTKAIALNEDLCESLGINTLRYKIIVFVIGSFFAGIAGVLYVHFIGYISPMDFGTQYTYEIIAAVIIGGPKTFFGPILGILLLTIIKELLRNFQVWVDFVYGIFLILILLLLPEGLGSIVAKLWYSIISKKNKKRKAVEDS